MKITMTSAFKWYTVGQVLDCSKAVAYRLVGKGVARLGEIECEAQESESEPVNPTQTAIATPPITPAPQSTTPPPKKRGRPRKTRTS